MPPPAAAAQRRQLEFEVQTGVLMSAVMRPAMWYCAPLKLRTPGWVACVGPIRLHSNAWFVLLALPVPSLFSPYVPKVWSAIWAAFGGMVPVGDARRMSLSN